MIKNSSDDYNQDMPFENLAELKDLRSRAYELDKCGVIFIDEGNYSDFLTFAHDCERARVLAIAKAQNGDCYCLAVGRFTGVLACTIIKDNTFIK